MTIELLHMERSQSGQELDNACVTVLHERLREHLGEKCQLTTIDSLYVGPTSSTYRLHVTTDEGEQHYCAKFHRISYLRRDVAATSKGEFDVLSMLCREMQGLSGQYGVVRPVIYVPEYHCIVTEEFLGESLQDCIKRRITRFKLARQADLLDPLIVLCAQWFKSYLSITDQGREEEYNVRSIGAEFARKLGQCCNTAFINPKLKTRLGSAFNERAKAVAGRSFQVAGNNPDTALFNVLTDGKRIVMLDFAEFTYGDPYYDASLFWASIGRLAINPLLDGKRIAQVQDAFLREFRTLPFFEQDIWDFFKLVTAVHMAHVSTSIRNNPRRRTLLNMCFYSLIRGYYNRLLEALC